MKCQTFSWLFARQKSEADALGGTILEVENCTEVGRGGVVCEKDVAIGPHCQMGGGGRPGWG